MQQIGLDQENLVSEFCAATSDFLLITYFSQKDFNTFELPKDLFSVLHHCHYS